MTEERAKRKLTAIFSADVKGYSRLMREDELATVETLKKYREIMASLIQEYRGRVVDTPGDNVLAEFSSVVDAVQCAVRIQEELKTRNTELPENRRMEFRIGINLGDVIEEEDRIYGDGVNIAARIESLAEGGGICISSKAYEEVRNKLSLGYEYLGEHTVKNIVEPVRVYRVLTEPEAAGKVVEGKRPKPRQWRWAALAIAAVLVLGAAVAIWNFYFRPPPMEPASLEKMAFPLPDKPSIAVLPFVNMSGDPKQEYFSDGITEEIITALSKVPRLFVIARNSTFTYKGKPVKVQKVSEDLGVRYVLEGSVRTAGDRVRITAQLIDAIKGHHLWAERYDRDMKDIFALQDEITLKILMALQVKLTEGEQRVLLGKGTDNLDAYLKLLQSSEHAVRFTKEDNVLARQLAEEAIALDPGYAMAYLRLSATHLMDLLYGSSKSPRESLRLAEELVQKALALDASLAEAHAFLGRIYLTKRQHEKAIAEGERSLAMAPNSAFIHAALAFTLRHSGRPEEAIALFKKAIRLNPITPPWYLWGLGLSYFMLAHFDEAIAEFRKALNRAPDSQFSHMVLAATYSELGREEEARAAAAEVLRIDPTFSLEQWAKTHMYKNQADLDRFVEALRKAGLPETPPLPLPDKPSIAVLAFTNMSGDPEQEYFCDGITEQIITGLSTTPKLFVIARNSTFTYKGKAVKVQQVAEELGVRYVLEGSVQKAKDKVRISTQLVDALTGHHLWAHHYDRELKDIFALQDEITMNVITALQVKLTEGEQARMLSRGTDNLGAYLKLLQARELVYRFNKADNALARLMIEEVIALDPEYAYAYVTLGATHMMDVWLKSSKSPKESFSRAIELTQKGLALDDSLSNAHSTLGLLYGMTGRHEKAIAECERAVELGPNDEIAYRRLGTALSYVGRHEEAIPLYEKAIRLNPFPRSTTHFHLGLAYLFTGRCEEAIASCKKATQAGPNNLLAHVFLTAAYGSCGREEEARATAAEVLRIGPTFSVEDYARHLKFKEDDKELVIQGLRKAGLK
jgi:adenylate cyclase